MRRPRLLVLVLLCLAFAGIAPARGELTPVGGEISILDEPECNEQGLDVAPLPGGGFVAVWSRTPDPDRPGITEAALYARVFDGAGQPLGPARRFATGTPSDRPTVTANRDGFVLVAWHGLEVNGAVAQVFGIADGRLTAILNPVVLPGSSPSSGLDAAPEGAGFALLMTESSKVFLLHFGPGGALTASDLVRPADTSLPFWSVAHPRLAPHGSTGFAAVWTAEQGRHRRIEMKILDLSIAPLFIVRSSQSPGAGLPGNPDVASALNGNVVVTWQETRPGSQDLYDRGFDGTGTPLSEARRLSGPGEPFLSAAALESDGAGGFLAAWVRPSAVPAPPDVALEIAIRPLSPEGESLEPVTRIASLDVGSATEVVMALGERNRLIVAWDATAEITVDPCGTFGLFAQLFDVTGPILPLQGGRFEVRVHWTDHQGHSGEGQAVPLTGDSGYFWFFGPDNIELMVKVLDGRAVNGRFWVFYASLSDVAYTVTVIDTVTAILHDYENPAGQLASHADTSTFVAGAPEDAAKVQVSGPAIRAAAETSPAGPCTDPSLPVVIRPGLCLGDRFEVEVSWRDPATGATGAGEGVRLTADSGYLWFFGANNVEIVAKVLDGRAVNGHFWFFYGALSNVEYDVKVRDIVTGAERTYHNPAGRLASVADTAAF